MDQAAAWLSRLGPEQQLALQRSMRAFEAAGPMFNAAARVRELAGRGADLGRRAAAGAADLTRRAADAGDRIVASAAGFGADAGQRTSARASDLGRRAAAAAEWTAVAAAGAGHRISDTARQGANAVSRWWNRTQGTAKLRAAAVRGAFQAARLDPSAREAIGRSGISSQQLLRMNQAFVAGQFAPDRGQADRAYAQVAQLSAAAEGSARYQGQHRAAESGRAGRPGGNALDTAWVLSGSPSASGAVQQGPNASESATRPAGGPHRPDRGRGV